MTSTVAGMAQAGEPASRSVHTVAGPNGDYRLPIRSLRTLRFAGVIRQQRDFSCGSAALATMLRYHYGQLLGEHDVFEGMWAHGDRARIRAVGFSLLDMKRYLATRGYLADGFKVNLDQIASVGTPGIALLTINGYRHFVVIKGVTLDNVLVADPALGLRVLSRARFMDQWNGIYFVLSPKVGQKRPRFNATEDWGAAPDGTMAGAIALRDQLQLQVPRITSPDPTDF